MKKTLFAALAFVMMVGVAIILPLSSAQAVEVFSAETETRIYNPEKSYGGYFIPSQSNGGTTYLIDMMGNVVHEWAGVGGTPQLMPNGNLSSRGQIMDWDGNILWSYAPADYGRADWNMHHDSRLIWNKKLKQYTLLAVARPTTTKADIIAAGGDPNWDYGSSAGAKGAVSRTGTQDGMIEVNMNKEIVWEWKFMDHTVQSKNPAWPNYITDVAKAPGRLDVSWMTDMQAPEGTAGVCNDWMHVNSLDYNEELDQVVINAKHWSTFFVIDHGKTFVSTTKWADNTAAAKGPAGDFIYRFGSPASYNQGAAPGFQTTGHNQMFGAHNIQWIRPYHWERPHSEAGDKWPDPVGYTQSGISLPGAGNFLVYDNGVFRPTGYQSRVLEINPFLNAAGVNTGAYVNPPAAGYVRNIGAFGALGGYGNQANYISKQVVWSYKSKSPTSFFSPHISGMQRLPNGNTSIHSGTQGHLFEVTPTGEVVWEYQWPDVAGPTCQAIVTDDFLINMFRHYRYGTDYPAFAGRDLTPTGTLTGLEPRLVSESRTQQTSKYGFGFGSAFGGGGSGGVGAGAGGGTGY